MLPPLKQLIPEDHDWQQLCQKLQASNRLTAIVLTAWQMGLWIAKTIVEQQLTERAQAQTNFGLCPVCQTPLRSKGFIKRELLTLVGSVEWKRCISRCPKRCPGSQMAPFDTVLGIDAYQQTSTELIRLGCLLAVFLPFGLAASILQQLTGIILSKDTIWDWVQIVGHKAMAQLETQLQDLAIGHSPKLESLDAMLKAMPLIIAADGVTVPFRPLPKIPKGKIVWKEIKVALLTRLGKHSTTSGNLITRLHQRRFVAVLGDIDSLKSRLQVEAFRQGIKETAQVVWISDGARGFWRLYRECFAEHAIGILDFYHAVQYLWQAAIAYQDGKESPNPSDVV